MCVCAFCGFCACVCVWVGPRLPLRTPGAPAAPLPCLFLPFPPLFPRRSVATLQPRHTRDHPCPARHPWTGTSLFLLWSPLSVNDSPALRVRRLWHPFHERTRQLRRGMCVYMRVCAYVWLVHNRALPTRLSVALRIFIFPRFFFRCFSRVPIDLSGLPVRCVGVPPRPLSLPPSTTVHPCHSLCHVGQRHRGPFSPSFTFFVCVCFRSSVVDTRLRSPLFCRFSTPIPTQTEKLARRRGRWGWGGAVALRPERAAPSR